MTFSLTFLRIVLVASVLTLGSGAASAQQVADGGGWYGKVQQASAHPIRMRWATVTGGNDVYIPSDINNDGSSDYVAAGIYHNQRTGIISARVYAYSGLTNDTLFAWTSADYDFGSRLEVAIVGDINADGFPDVLLGAPEASLLGNHECGAAVLISGLNGTTLKTWIGPHADARFGSSVAGVDDVDRNGFRDVLIGAPGASHLGRPNVGAAHVFSGSWNGSPNIGDILYTFVGAHSEAAYGRKVAAGDDTNRDGFPDFVISAPGHTTDLGHVISGVVEVRSGQNGSLLARYTRDSLLHFGHSIAGVSDMDRDGYPDIAVGAPSFDSDPSPIAGGVLVFSGLTGKVIRRFQSHVIGDGFGYTTEAVGDTNNDFWPDILVGAPLAEGGRGSATLFSGENGATLFRTLGEDAEAHLGTSLASSGSLNRYGFVDLLMLSSSNARGAIISRYAFKDGLKITSSNSVSSSAPTRVKLNINMPHALAGSTYKILATTRGTAQWVTPTGIQIPLADSTTLQRALAGTLPGFFHHELGTLSSRGNASATIDFPANYLAGLVGSSIHFSAIFADGLGDIMASTVARELQITF